MAILNSIQTNKKIYKTRQEKIGTNFAKYYSLPHSRWAPIGFILKFYS